MRLQKIVVKYILTPFTSREWYNSSLKIWLAIVLLATFLCFAIAPFSTDKLVGWFRILFWFFANSTAALLMYMIIELSRRMNINGYWVSAIFNSVLFSSLFMPIWNFLEVNIVHTNPSNFLQTWFSIFLITFVIFALIWLASPNPNSTKKTPRLSQRLKKFPNATILAVSSQDHYVEIKTSDGNELLRMRFQDAMKELPSGLGVQIHRSHWVSKAAIKKIERNKQHTSVTLSNGETFPVSRKRNNALHDVIASNLYE